MRSQVDVSIQLFPRRCALIVEGYAVYTCIPATVKEEAPSVWVVVFPAIREGLFVAGKLQHLRVRVFPPDTPAVVRSIKVRDS